MPIPNLDNARIYKERDPEGMLARIGELPWQCRQAWQEAMRFSLPTGYANIDKVVILGMGGSAIGGDLLSGIVSGECKVPVLVLRDYHLPAFVNERTLVIASSYSGNTEETLTAFGEALRNGSKKLAITHGGKLKEIAEKASIPVFCYDYKAQPRAALGFGLLPALCFLQKLGMVADKSVELAGMVTTLLGTTGRMAADVPKIKNPAKQLAERLHGRLPVIYGAGALAEVARRWKTQFNENSKAWAFYEVFPELNHNAVVGYQFPKALAKQVKVVMLNSPLLEPRVKLRYRITREILDKAGVEHETIEGRGDNLLSQVMSLVLFGDYVSYYLAILYGVDPSPVEVINYLKGELGKG